MRTTVRLPESLVSRAKEKALSEGTTLTALIERGLRQVVDTPGKPRRRRRPFPRVSSEVGRQLVDTVKMSELLDVMEEGLPLEKLR